MPVHPTRRRSGVSWILVVLVLVIGVAGTAGTLWALGEISLPFLPKRGVSAEEAFDPKGRIAVPMSGRAIHVYTKLTRDDIWDTKNNRVRIVYLDPAHLPEGVVTDMKLILGRVLKDEKPAGYVFKESEFLPEGTRPGLTAGIPAGKRAMRVEATKVKGLFGLQPGDRFDLVATLPIKADAKDLAQVNGAFSSQLSLEARLTNWLKQATVTVIVQNGVIVTAVETRQEPTTIRSLTQGQLTRTRPVQEMVLAIDPGEVAPLTQALAVEAELECIPRSGRPDDPADSVTPDLKPRSPFAFMDGGLSGSTPSGSGFAVIDTISGSKRELMAVPEARGAQPPKKAN